MTLYVPVGTAVVHVADARGEPESVQRSLVPQRHVPDVVLAHCRREHEAKHRGSVVAREVAAQRVYVVGNLPPLEVAEDPTGNVETDIEVVVVVHGGIVHLAAEIDQGDVVRCRRLVAERKPAEPLV